MPSEHYREAERLLESVTVPVATEPLEHIRAIKLAMAQVHATLASVDRTTALEAGNL